LLEGQFGAATGAKDFSKLGVSTAAEAFKATYCCTFDSFAEAVGEHFGYILMAAAQM
jgi:hypothetical protein